jgi:adenylate cyclase class 2
MGLAKSIIYKRVCICNAWGKQCYKIPDNFIFLKTACLYRYKKMAEELECKLKIPERESFATKLVNLGAEDHSDALERNWVFDYPDKSLRQNRKLLRVRDYKGGCLTYKGAVKKSSFKRREEIETQTNDPETLCDIFKKIGLVQSWYYEKYRHEFELGNAEVVLDKIPELGCFIEIEAEKEETISNILKKLGLNPEDNISKSYLQLFEEHCKKSGTDLKDMKF